MLKVQRAAAEAELDREWLAQGGELAMKYRDAEFERFKETWLKAADARKRLAPEAFVAWRQRCVAAARAEEVSAAPPMPA